jgi:hypothetical protein
LTSTKKGNIAVSLAVIEGKALSLNNDWKKVEINHGGGNTYFVFSMLWRNVTFGKVFLNNTVNVTNCL